LYQLLLQYIHISIFRAAPQDLPGQTVVLWISIAAAFITGVAGMLFAYDLAEALWRSVLALVIPAAVVFMFLKFRSLESRFNQTFSAMCGSAAVIYVLAFPFMPYFFNADAQTQSGKWLIMLVLIIDVWALLITAHILKNAMNIAFSTGISLSVALMLITLFIIETIAPRQLGPAASQTDVSSVINTVQMMNLLPV